VGVLRGVGAADRLCEVCVSLLGIEAAAISLVYEGANVGTLGASGTLGRVYDELQFTLGEGPCLDSVASRAVVLVADLADPNETRWPMYGPAMLAHQIRGVSAMPVVVAGEYLGALDLFRTEPGVVAGEELAGALIAAELAQLSRAEVAQATGMLIAQLDVGPTEALVRLRAHAYSTGASATEVARDIIDRRLRLEAH